MSTGPGSVSETKHEASVSKLDSTVKEFERGTGLAMDSETTLDPPSLTTVYPGLPELLKVTLR